MTALQAATQKLAEYVLANPDHFRSGIVPRRTAHEPRAAQSVDEVLFAGVVELISRQGLDWMHVLDENEAEYTERAARQCYKQGDDIREHAALKLLGLE